MIQNMKVRATLEEFLPYLLVIGGLVGLACSFILSYEKLEILKNPAFTPNCNLNPVISCGNVMTSRQADVFGFPNSWIGLVGFGLVACIGATLIAGATFKRWFWRAFLIGMALAMIFAYWLLGQSVYVVGALCPYCLTVDVVLTAMSWYLVLYFVDLHKRLLPARAAKLFGFVRKHHMEILITWFLVLLALILQHFWYYYGQFL